MLLFNACVVFINITIQTSISIEPGVEVEVTIADAWTFNSIIYVLSLLHMLDMAHVY